MSLVKKNKSRTTIYMLYMKRPPPCLSHSALAPCYRTLLSLLISIMQFILLIVDVPVIDH